MRYELASDKAEAAGWPVVDTISYSTFWVDCEDREHAQAYVGIKNLVERPRRHSRDAAERARVALTRALEGGK